ncbi:hypothetical protein CsatA_022790 [Cannabis sativa]
MIGAGSVAWESLCKAKKEGGLGLLNVAQWNTAAMFKHVWAVANKKDNLWVKWVHCVYIKHHNWWEYKVPQTSSWYWKKMVDVRDIVKEKLQIAEFTRTEFKVAAGYRVLVTDHDRVTWSNEVWSRLNIPKHSFLTWLAMLNRLKTKDRLYRFKVTDSNTCPCCNNAEENVDHLFFKCQFSQQCLQLLKDWLKWHTKAETLGSLVKIIHKARQNRFRKGVKAVCITALVYLIWRSRNNLIWNDKSQQPVELLQQLKKSVKTRLMVVMPKKVKNKDREWFDCL